MKDSEVTVLKPYAKPVLQPYGSLEQITQGRGGGIGNGKGAIPAKPPGCGDGLGENNNSVGSFLSKPGRQKEGISRRC